MRITFIINLLDTGNTLLTPEQALIIANTKTTFIPLGLTGGDNLELKNGQIFTLEGAQAVHLRKLIESGQFGTVIQVYEPNSISANTLYGVVGRNANVLIESALYKFNVLDGSIDELFTRFIPANQTFEFGEAIAWDSNKLYHLTLRETDDGPSVPTFENIDLDTLVVTNIPLTGDAFDEPKAMVYAGTGIFLATDETGFFSITSSGVAVKLSNNGGNYKGMAFLNGKLYATSRNSDKILTIDASNGSMLTQTTMTFGENSMSGSRGLANYNDTLYILFSGGFGNKLFTVNTENGNLTEIGNIDTFAGLAKTTYQSQDTLIGVSGISVSDPTLATSLYPISISDATLGELILSLSSGLEEFGEAIAFNTNDRFLYHATVREFNYVDRNVFEKVNLNTRSISEIELSGYVLNSEEPTAMVYLGSDVFLMTTIYNNLYSITSDGEVSLILNGLSVTVKGMAFLGTTLFATSRDTDQLYSMNPENGDLTNVVTLTLEGFTVNGSTGLANYNGTLIAIIKDQSNSRHLVNVDSSTGVCTEIAPIDFFASISEGIAT